MRARSRKPYLPGKPSLGPCPLITFFASPALNQEIREIARREGNPISATVRRLITLGLRRDRQINGIAPGPEVRS